MRSTNVTGGTYSLLVLTPILPGAEDELRTYLDGLRTQDSPLAKLPRTHVARWIVLPDMPSPPGADMRDPLGGPYLLFTSNFDGGVDSYLHELCELMSSEAAAIWGHCVGCPRPAEGAALKAYLHRNQLHSGFAFAAYGDASVQRIKTALSKRERLVDFVIRAQDMEPAERRRALLEEFGRA